LTFTDDMMEPDTELRVTMIMRSESKEEDEDQENFLKP
jgi:hypothetical protein